MQIRSFLISALAAGTATAHMNMKDPPPLAYKGNPNAKEPNIDYSITSPITQAQYPCKNYLKLLGTPEGASVKTYAPGEDYTMSVEGGASHDGGSCQLSLSYDKGNTFTVIKSFIGNCPTSSGGTFNFKMPADAPEGDDVVFAWTWVNHTGNREYYMSCAVVTIKGGASKRDAPVKPRDSVAFASRPKVFQANLGGEYCTKEGVDTVYPEPGPDVENTSTKPGPAVLCSSGADVPEGSTGGSDSGSGSGSSASAGSSSAAATTPAATSAAQQTSAAASSTSVYVNPSSPSSQVSDVSSIAASSPSHASGVLTVIPITGLTSSSTGGVFLTVPASSGGAASTPAPTTLATSTKAAQTSSAAASSSAAAGGNTGSATSSANAPAGTGGAAGTQSGACTDEGAWACAADGSSFQRCASGQWSAAMPMSQGTKCSPGVSNTLSMRRRGGRVLRSAPGRDGLAW
ncbi:uncharacterized protein F4822DRAFT_253237 [Hypoxylon trugodes]|uniref:uncharacterized protein n=1 Tax=Hypoxylon trugodes TaxID=326681 RepID=UPI00219C0599|nr:uncharacterized protein F4822DRAFT_253237 [Hypoxylon trugodes]KAI1388679.1 hypothetical protein F4822DRAFT_253237 [Hypoxylon trugodes]